MYIDNFEDNLVFRSYSGETGDAVRIVAIFGEIRGL
jgi:hypothetical protein